MPLPYTDSPLGALLSTLGQGIPAIAELQRQHNIQDTTIALQQKEAQSKLASEELQRKLTQSNLDDIPTERARKTYNFEAGIDPYTAIQNADVLRQAGVPDMVGKVPTPIANTQKENEFKGNILDQLLGKPAATAPPPAAPPTPVQAAPPSMPVGPGMPSDAPDFLRPVGSHASTAPSPAPAAADVPPAPSASSGNPIAGLSLARLMRMTGILNGPETPQEIAENEAARTAAGIAAKQSAGELPEADAKFVQTAMGYKNMLDDAVNGLKDPEVQKGGLAKMQLEHFYYTHNLGNSPKYAAIIPPMDMGKAVTLTDLASGVRNPQVRREIGQHLADSDMSPTAMLQRAQAIQKYYPYMVYERYASRGVKIPDAVAQGLGYKDGNALVNYAKTVEAGSGPAGAAVTGATRTVTSDATHGQDPNIAAYAAQFKIPYETAAAKFAAAGYGR